MVKKIYKMVMYTSEIQEELRNLVEAWICESATCSTSLLNDAFQQDRLVHDLWVVLNQYIDLEGFSE